MKLKSSILSGLFVLSSIPGAISSSIPESNNLSFESSSILYDLKSDPNFNMDSFKLNESVSDSKSIQAIALTRENTSLYFYCFNENGKSLGENLISMQLSISTSSDYSDTHYYSALVLDKTDDNLFYKFKITGVKTSTSYHIADIEFDYGKGYASGRHNTIAKSYFFDNTSSKTPSRVKDLEVVNIKINPGNYRFPTINGNGYYTDLFYITFQLSNDYGDLIGIKLKWIEDVTDYYSKTDLAHPQNSYTLDHSHTSDLIEMSYTNKDLMNIESINSIGSSFHKFILNTNPYYWFTDQNTDYSNIRVIEKIKYDNKNLSKFENYYFNEQTINSLNSQYYETIGGSKSQYVIRFCISDFFWDSYQKGGLITVHKKTEIKDCDVLTLTFCKDGEVYTLMASSKPVDYDPGNETPVNSFINWLEDIFNQLKAAIGDAAVIVFILGLVLIPLLICWLLKFLFIPKDKDR